MATACPLAKRVIRIAPGVMLAGVALLIAAGGRTSLGILGSVMAYAAALVLVASINRLDRKRYVVLDTTMPGHRMVEAPPAKGLTLNLHRLEEVHTTTF